MTKSKKKWTEVHEFLRLARWNPVSVQFNWGGSFAHSSIKTLLSDAFWVCDLSGCRHGRWTTITSSFSCTNHILCFSSWAQTRWRVWCVEMKEVTWTDNHGPVRRSYSCFIHLSSAKCTDQLSVTYSTAATHSSRMGSKCFLKLTS